MKTKQIWIRAFKLKTKEIFRQIKLGSMGNAVEIKSLVGQQLLNAEKNFCSAQNRRFVVEGGYLSPDTGVLGRAFIEGTKHLIFRLFCDLAKNEGIETARKVLEEARSKSQNGFKFSKDEAGEKERKEEVFPNGILDHPVVEVGSDFKDPQVKHPGHRDLIDTRDLLKREPSENHSQEALALRTLYLARIRKLMGAKFNFVNIDSAIVFLLTRINLNMLDSTLRIKVSESLNAIRKKEIKS